MVNLGRLKQAAAIAAAWGAATAAHAAVTTIPQSALTSSSGYFTSDLGAVMVTTGGGNAANVGDPTGRNDDGFRGPVALGFNFTLFGTICAMPVQ